MTVNNERGAVLAQVLVATVLLAIITTSILRVRLQPALLAAGAVTRAGEELSARGALNRVSEVWGRLGSCASDVTTGVRCSGSGCRCTCVVGAAVVTAVPQGGACSLRVTAQ